MDDGQQPQHKDGRYKMEYFKGLQAQWNIMPQHQMKEPSNALVMNWKTMAALAERDAAIRERNIALCEKKEALDARDQALEERDKAVAERDDALMARDSALAALQYHEAVANVSLSGGYQRGGKRMLQHHSTSHSGDVSEALNSGDIHATDATPITVILSETKSHQAKRTKEKKVVTKPSVSPRRVKKVGEDLNKKVASEGKKIKSETDSQDGLNLVNFDETTIPVPVCSCTGTPHQCYKWGNGGWQSSCCTTTLSSYPLPQIPNKRHARVGGRKMSGSVFTKLLSRLAAEGHDLSVPLDLKNFWARHGTNRYITIK